MKSENIQNQSLTTTGSSEISVYRGELTKAALVEQSKRILRMFPKFPAAMIEELKNAFAENGFTDERMRDAVNHVRDTYEGWDKLPNIANFIQFDRKIRTFTHKEACEVGMKGLVPVDIGLSKPRWVYSEEADGYKLPRWESRKN